MVCMWQSICDDEEVKSKIRDGIAQDGSSLGVITCQRPAFVKVNPDGDIFLQLSLVAVEVCLFLLSLRQGRTVCFLLSQSSQWTMYMSPPKLHCRVWWTRYHTAFPMAAFWSWRTRNLDHSTGSLFPPLCTVSLSLRGPQP